MHHTGELCTSTTLDIDDSTHGGTGAGQTTEEAGNGIAYTLPYQLTITIVLGFGDIVATTLLGRILSVVLGIYGIVVVALITSIIVNFYNETKHDDDELIEEINELEEQRKFEEEPLPPSEESPLPPTEEDSETKPEENKE